MNIIKQAKRIKELKIQRNKIKLIIRRNPDSTAKRRLAKINRSLAELQNDYSKQ